jgi:uncharacterized surface anchored protein
VSAGRITIYNRDTDVDISVLKVDAADENEKLPKAEFQISKLNEQKTYQAYDFANNSFIEAGGNSAASKRETDEEGKLSFTGLLDGKYKLEETKSPPGYIKVADNDIYFIIADGLVTWTDENGAEIEEEEVNNVK